MVETNEAGAQRIEPRITITPAAARQVQRSLAKQGLDAFLRIGVKGGGCSGLSYFIEPGVDEDDLDRTWDTQEGIRVVVDVKSLEFLTGMTIDYSIKNLMEGGFIYNNPNAARSCGCGTSFTPTSQDSQSSPSAS